MIESQDSDKMTRMVTPIYIYSNVIAESGFTSINKLNTFMDHSRNTGNDSFNVSTDDYYFSQFRLSRWPSLLQTGFNEKYEISYTGTPPEKQKLQLRGDSENSGAVVYIKYPKAGSYQILNVNRTKVPANKWSDTVKNYRPIQGDYCGENRYLGV